MSDDRATKLIVDQCTEHREIASCTKVIEAADVSAGTRGTNRTARKSRMLFAGLALSFGLCPVGARADEWQKLVCRSMDDYIVYFGHTIRLTLNMTRKIVWDDKGGRSEFEEEEGRLGWTRNGVILGTPYSWRFELDRSTLVLNVATWSAANYQCQKDEPQL